MASFSMHLVIAKFYLQKHPEENEEEFIEGSIAPDITKDKSVTHYGKDAAWSNPAKYLQANDRKIENSYKRGYFLHLITDFLFYHKLVDIEEVASKSIKDESVKDKWIKNQRNDFSILEGEIRERYDIEKYIDRLPENIRKVMTRAEGELKVFERKSLFKFLEDMAQVDLDKMAEELLQDPEKDLIKLYEELSLHQIQKEGR